MKLIRLIVILAACVAVIALIRTAYVSGRYVGVVQTRVEAIEHHCGYLDQNGYHWRMPLTVDPSYYEIDDSGRFRPLMY